MTLAKNIVKHCSTVVKYFETTISTKMSTVNHYLINCNTKNLLSKNNYHVAWLNRYKFCCKIRILQDFLMNQKMTAVNPLFNDKYIENNNVYIIICYKRGLTVGIFYISTFSMVWCLFLLYLMEIFPMTHNFWKKILLSTA